MKNTLKMIVLALSFSNLLAQSLPKRLLIYYGYPSAINGATNINTAANEFSSYDFIVWGDSIELHSKVKGEKFKAYSVLSKLRQLKSSTKVFGYLYLGTTLSDKMVHELDFQKRIDSLYAFGFDGILFDECGYSPVVDGNANCSRQRLATAVNYAHSKGMIAIGNTQFPEEILRNISSDYNLSNLPTPFTASDYYLYESYVVRFGDYYKNGQQAPHNEWEYWRLTKSQQLKLETPSGIVEMPTLSVGTSDSGFPKYKCEIALFSQTKIDSLFQFVWHAAWINGHVATGWGECTYSANNYAPLRPIPVIVTPGNLSSNTTIFLIRDTKKSPFDSVYYYRETSTGRIWINTGLNKHYGFSLNNENYTTESGSWFNLNTWSMYHLPTNQEKVFIFKHSGNGILIPSTNMKAQCKSFETQNGAIIEIQKGGIFICPN